MEAQGVARRIAALALAAGFMAAGAGSAEAGGGHARGRTCDVRSSWTGVFPTEVARPYLFLATYQGGRDRGTSVLEFSDASPMELNPDFPEEATFTTGRAVWKRVGKRTIDYTGIIHVLFQGEIIAVLKMSGRKTFSPDCSVGTGNAFLEVFTRDQDPFADEPLPPGRFFFGSLVIRSMRLEPTV